MTQSNDKVEAALTNFSEKLEALVDQVKNSNTGFDLVNQELAVLHANVKRLSKIITDDNGTMSVITRLALLEEKITHIKEWQENYQQESKNKLEEDIKELNDELEEIQRVLITINNTIDDHSQKFEEAEQEERLAKELEEAEKKGSIQIETSKHQFRLNILKIVIGGIITLLVGYATAYFTQSNHHTQTIPDPTHQIQH